MNQTEIEILQSKLDKPVVLVGMMGAGKSYLGAALARSLDMTFYDSDKLIEQKAGLPITEIFDLFGEEKFRTSERNTIQELLEKPASVLATGGGALTSEETAELLQNKAIMIWLDVDVETLWARVQKSQNRPLLLTDDPKAKLQALMIEREKLYQQAHIHVQTGRKGQQNDVEALTKALYEFVNTDTV